MKKAPRTTSPARDSGAGLNRARSFDRIRPVEFVARDHRDGRPLSTAGGPVPVGTIGAGDGGAAGTTVSGTDVDPRGAMMIVNRVDQRTVRSALELATRAPSVHNSQPWRWRIGDRSVHLYADHSRRLPATDPDGRDWIVSCGAALHHLRIALAASGISAIVQRMPNPSEPDHLATTGHPARPRSGSPPRSPAGGPTGDASGHGRCPRCSPRNSHSVRQRRAPG
jgi:hypothetical protein